MFKSDFKFVADCFVQLRTTKNYIPSKETMEHVDAVLKIMSVLTKDVRFEEAASRAGMSTEDFQKKMNEM